VRIDAGLRPGVGFIAYGAVFIALAVERVATNWTTGPRSLVFEFGSYAVGSALGLWGWSRLRRAKANRPDLTWWQFLHNDLIGLGIGVVLIAGFLALSPEQRDGLVRSLREFADLVSIARGRP
jgi:hypothetical protein